MEGHDRNRKQSERIDSVRRDRGNDREDHDSDREQCIIALPKSAGSEVRQQIREVAERNGLKPYFREAVDELELELARYNTPASLFKAAEGAYDRMNLTMAADCVWFSAAFTVKECFLQHNLFIQKHTSLSKLVDFTTRNGTLMAGWSSAQALHRYAYGLPYDEDACFSFEENMERVEKFVQRFPGLGHYKAGRKLRRKIKMRELAVFDEPGSIYFCGKKWYFKQIC